MNKPPSENLPGDGDAVVPVSVFLRLPFALGAAAGDVAGAAAGLVAAPAPAFLRLRFAFAPAGDSAGAGDSAVSPGEAVV